ncbi:hypothetical protein ABIE67_009650 [Streptomyces sp. V4I8]
MPDTAWPIDGHPPSLSRDHPNAGRAGLAAVGSRRVSGREERLEAEIEELKTALGEAHVELRVWKKSAEDRLAPSRTSR